MNSEYTFVTTMTEEALEPKPKKKKKSVLIAILLLLVIAGGIGGYWYTFMRGFVFSDDARFDGGLLDVAPQVSGNLMTVNVNEGDRVEKGQLLFALDKKIISSQLSKTQAQQKSARSNLDAARAQFQKVLKGPMADEIVIAESVLQQSKLQLKQAKIDWLRSNSLYMKKVGTKSSWDRTKTAFEIAHQNYRQAVTRLRMLKLGSRDEDISASRAAVKLREAQLTSAKAAVHQTKINLGYTKVNAPFTGLVVRKWQTPGALVTAGRPVLTLFNPADLEVCANIEEKYLNQINIGDPVDISIDAYPNTTMTGRVSKILRATSSKFSLIPSEGSSGTFIKVAQRVPIKVKVDTLPDLPLGPGLSVEIRIHINPSKLVSLF